MYCWEWLESCGDLSGWINGIATFVAVIAALKISTNQRRHQVSDAEELAKARSKILTAELYPAMRSIASTLINLDDSLRRLHDGKRVSMAWVRGLTSFPELEALWGMRSDLVTIPTERATLTLRVIGRLELLKDKTQRISAIVLEDAYEWGDPDEYDPDEVSFVFTERPRSPINMDDLDGIDDQSMDAAIQIWVKESEAIVNLLAVDVKTLGEQLHALYPLAADFALDVFESMGNILKPRLGSGFARHQSKA